MAQRSSRAVLLALVAGLLLVASVAWVLLGTDTGQGGATRESAAHPASDHDVPPPQSAHPVLVEEAVSAPPRAPSVVASRRATRIPGKDEFLIEVVDAITREAVAGASVFWMSDVRLVEHSGSSDGYDPYVDRNELLEEFGDRTQCDANGLAIIARPRGPVCFLAERDARWGFHHRLGTAKEDGVTLELSAEDCVRVQVLDPTGLPLPGMTVAFGVKGGNLGEQSRRARTQEPDGIALLKDLKRYVRGFSPGGTPWGAMLLAPCLAPPWVEFDPQRPPRGLIVLAIPDGGSMTVTFVGRDGNRVDETIDTNVIVWPHIDPSQVPAPTTRRSILARQLRAEHGTLEFPDVGPGLDFSFFCKIEGELVANSHGIAGPALIGEHVDRTVSADAGLVRLSGRILDAGGEPLRFAPIELHLILSPDPRTNEPRKQPDPARGTTDRDGRYELTTTVLGPLGAQLSVENFVTRPDGSMVTFQSLLTTVRDRGLVDLGEKTLPVQ